MFKVSTTVILTSARENTSKHSKFSNINKTNNVVMKKLNRFHKPIDHFLPQFRSGLISQVG